MGLLRIIQRNHMVLRHWQTHWTRKMSAVSNISVSVKQGTVIGNQFSLPNGDPYYTFQGIPYAVPPVGSLRFKAPIPLQKFDTEVLDCTAERDVSLHRDPWGSEVVGSENCLFLNVYTPDINPNLNMPVMFWIHGGAFSMGSGNSDFYLPVPLMEEGVVVVTLNYRLSMFGFLSMPDENIPGNAGLKDQLLALKWINENIQSFGGNSKNVTLFGQSAGAAAVHLHVLSNNSSRYFHKAIMQSGTANMEWVMQKEPVEKARKLAKLMGCESNSDKEVAEFLTNTKDPVELHKHLLGVLSPDERRRGLPIPFKPVVEPHSTDSIVTQPPLKAHTAKGTVKMPLMMGYTSAEGIAMLANATRRLEIFDKDLARLIPTSINLDPKNPVCLELAQLIREFYFDGKSITEENLDNFSDLMTDYHFAIGLNVIAETHAREQDSPLFLYRFSYDGGLNLSKKLFNLPHLKGACHCDELFYLFETKLVNEMPKPGSPDGNMVQTMSKLWTNFAKYGDPTPIESKLSFSWNPVKKPGENSVCDLDYLDIGEKITMSTNPDKARIDFWKNIYRKFNNNFLSPKL